MKLRIQGDSIRVRLTEEECAALASEGRVESVLRVGPSDSQRLAYSVESDPSAAAPSASFDGGRLRLVVEAAAARDLFEGATDRVEGTQRVGAGADLEILVERDYIP